METSSVHCSRCVRFRLVGVVGIFTRGSWQVLEGVAPLPGGSSAFRKSVFSILVFLSTMGSCVVFRVDGVAT